MDRLISKLRLISGLILASYVVQHLINHAFGIVSIANAERYRLTVGMLFQTTPGLILLYGSILIHLVIALRSIFKRSTLRMPPWQWAQLLLGLSILPLLLGHIIGNRGFHLLGDIDPGYYYVVTTLVLKSTVLLWTNIR
jgi:adenylate cyclase